ncbi:MAG: hypothetical protein COX57_03750 [Alphaproteobacteria bacterium CG_4_10_14_0_2_um_filter_63_37]|nr:MAG: alpha-L-glutamate ligase [Proteobacteria bacterium CG1_02_64_396]PJA25371.1 MAG: hypothetical protein COX57_03750 [Alphaproteobacteria bacterium CG_4_10_14_0_2_um_filter_63_37]
MKLVSFDPFRSLGIPGVTYLKPEAVFAHRDEVQAADWLLFPEYWQVNFLVYGWRKRVFPSHATYLMGHDKIEMTRALQSVAAPHVPQTLILPGTELAQERILEELSFPFVAKAARSSMGQGVFLIENRAQLRAYIADHSILYVQEHLPIDRDLRVVWVGDRVVTAYWRIGAEGGFKNNVAQGGALSFEGIPPQALTLVAKVAKKLKINHAGFDLALVGGHPYFLEFNVMFGNHGLIEQGIKLGPIILDYLNRQVRPPRRPTTPKPVLPKAS